MTRHTVAPPMLCLCTRLAALGGACLVTMLMVVAHAVDLSSLGGHDVVTAASVTRTVVASIATAAPHVDEAR